MEGLFEHLRPRRKGRESVFCVRMAGIPIGIEHRYSYIRRLCVGYITQDTPLFTVCASDQDLIREAGPGRSDSPAGAEKDSRFWGYCESLCLYRAICLHLVDYGAFLIHGAVVAVDGAAYVFCAPSGTGKTTHIRLWLEQFGPDAQVINGDKPILRFMDGVLCACGTPWNGKEGMGSNRICPVRAVCFLEQSPENHIRRLSGPAITPRLFHQLLVPRDQPRLDRFFVLLDQMVRTIPFYLLQCNRQPQAARLAYDTMRRNQDDKDQTGLSAAPAGR